MKRYSQWLGCGLCAAMLCSSGCSSPDNREMKPFVQRYNGVTGHRGNPVGAAPNTMAGFRQAIALGVDVVETDVHISSDGVLFICHDETTGSTCDRNLVIAQSTAEQLRTLNAAAQYNKTNPDSPTEPEPLPMLREVLALALEHPDVLFSLQPKADCVPQIAELVKEFGLEKRIAFNDGVLEKMLQAKQLLPDAVIFYDTYSEDQLNKGIPIAVENGFYSIVGYRGTLTGEQIIAIRDAGLEPGVWTVNDPEEMKRWFQLGVFRIYTDNPEKALLIKQEADALFGISR